jgi:starch phosphorylase
MICADFEAYRACKEQAAAAYRNRRDWARRVVFNIAGASRFSSDHTVRQYASEIWGIEPVKVDLTLFEEAGRPRIIRGRSVPVGRTRSSCHRSP